MSVGAVPRSIDPDSNTALMGEIRRLVAQQDQQAKWLDELSAKVQNGLEVQSPKDEPLISSEPWSPEPSTSKYQATVEDATATDDSLLSHSLPSQWEMPRRPSAEAQLSASLPPTPVQSPTTKPASAKVHFSRRRPVILHNRSSTIYYPVKEEEEPIMSPVDATWGVLFENGEPTVRMESVIRGLAKHIISNCSPYNSLTITPAKMAKFYARYTISSEAHPFRTLFSHNTTKESMRLLEMLYLDLKCEFHLVQDDSSDHSRPYIPALTPKGFIRWSSLLIKAYPDQEAHRFSIIAEDVALEAICGDDSKPERLPRQLSKHLFPATKNQKAFDLVTEEIRYWKQSLLPHPTAGVPITPNITHESAPPPPRMYRQHSRRDSNSSTDAVVCVPRQPSKPKPEETARTRSPPLAQRSSRRERSRQREPSPDRERLRRQESPKRNRRVSFSTRSPPGKERRSREETEYRRRVR